MATSNAQRFLATGGDDTALALKMFWGEVLESFRASTLLWNALGGDFGVGGASPQVVSSKDVGPGKSWQFPLLGPDPTPEYHTPGTELLGQVFTVDEGTITIDDILVAHRDLPLDQTRMSHFDVIRPVARQLGRALAEDFDEKLFVIGIKAAQTAAVTKNGVTIHNGGNQVERTGSGMESVYADSTSGSGLFRDDLAELAQLMDDDNVPTDNRYLFINPYMRRILRHQTNVFDRDYSDTANDLNKRSIGLVEGFQSFVTNHLPSTNITTGPSKYQGDFTYNGGGNGRPLALSLCGAMEGSAAIGYVSAGGIRSHMEFDERRNTTFMKAQMIVGAGVLAPWCAGEVHVDDS
jgi:hypothetical protein